VLVNRNVNAKLMLPTRFVFLFKLNTHHGSAYNFQKRRIKFSKKTVLQEKQKGNSKVIVFLGNWLIVDR
jgi:hypothetical protein